MHVAGEVVHDVAVGRAAALDQRLTPSRHRFNHHAATVAGHRVSSEEHAGRGRLDHALHDDRHRHTVRRAALLLAIGDGTARPERAPALLHRRDHRRRARDPEQRFLLAGKTGAGQVLGRGRRPHRHGRPWRSTVREVLVGGPNGRDGRGIERRPVEGSSDGRLGGGQRRRVRPVEGSRGTRDGLVQAGGGDKSVIDRSGHDKTGGNRQPRAEQFTEVGSLAAGSR